MFEQIINQLNINNYAEFNNNNINVKIHKSDKNNKSYYIQFEMTDFNQLKIFYWYKHLSFALYDYNHMVGHIHSIELLHTIINDSIKLSNLYVII